MASSRASRPSSGGSGARRLGREVPRVFTPPLRKIEPRTPVTEKRTHGYDVIDFAEQVCEIDLFPWQKWLLIHALELLPDQSFRFRNVIVLVARQNGKSTLSQVLALWFMYRYHANLVLGTAQDVDTAEEVWQGAVDLVDEIPELKELCARVVLNNGKKSLELKGGERYKVKAANRRAGRGLSGDLILLDELREHQSWDAWGAITKTTMAREEAMVWALSNAGDASSIVLRYLRKMAHAAVGDPDGINSDDEPASLLPDDDEAAGEFEIDDEDSLGIFEWSAPPGCDIWDRDGWAQANPSLGYTITERTISSAAKTDPEWVFRTEVLCQWSDGSLEGPFPPGMWENHHESGNPKGCLDPGSKVGDGNPIVVAVDVSWDRSAAHVAIAGLREDGLPHVGVIASRAGTDWVLPWLQGPDAPPFIGVAVQAKGAPASSLLEDFRAAGLSVIEWGGSDLTNGTGAFYDMVRDGKLRHRAQPVLDVAAATAVPKAMDGGAFLWDRRKSPTDAAPLIAVTGACWALTNHQEPTRSAYEDAGLMVV